MSKNNDIKPPNNIKDIELFEQNIIQGVSLQKDECGGENLRKVLRYFSSKNVDTIYLLLGDASWIYTYGMRELATSEPLGLKKKKKAEQVVELLDNAYLAKTYGDAAKKLGDEWLVNPINSDEYQEYPDVKIIKTSDIQKKYAEVFSQVKQFLVNAYLSQSDNEWVIKFKQGIGENARLYCTRNENLFKNQGLAFKLSMAHSLSEAILITTLAIAKRAKYFAYPDVNFHFIYPIKQLLLLDDSYKGIDILNSFCYKLPLTTNALIESPKKKKVLPQPEVITSGQTQKTTRSPLAFFLPDSGAKCQTAKSLESTEPLFANVSNKGYKNSMDLLLHALDQLEKPDSFHQCLLLSYLVLCLFRPTDEFSEETDSVLSYERFYAQFQQLIEQGNPEFSSTEKKMGGQPSLP